MISNPKPVASLSSTLLARKGQARPAMRPQGFVGLNPVTAQDDLGWNDMGDDALYPDASAEPAPEPMAEPAPKPAPKPAAKPVVLRQRDRLGKQFASAQAEPETPPAAAPDAVVAQVIREVTARQTKAAFTLRLDRERHLRLRLASVVTRRSAQQLACEALDQFLQPMTEVEALARQAGSLKG